MVSYNQDKEFKEQFLDNYDSLFDDVASSFSEAISNPAMTDEQRKEVIKKNIITTVLMSNVYWKEEIGFDRSKGQ